MEREVSYNEAQMMLRNITEALREKCPVKKPLIKAAEEISISLQEIDFKLGENFLKNVCKTEEGNPKPKEGVTSVKSYDDFDFENKEEFIKVKSELEQSVFKINIEEVSPKRATFVGSKIFDLETYLENSTDITGKTVVLLNEYFISKN